MVGSYNSGDGRCKRRKPESVSTVLECRALIQPEPPWTQRPVVISSQFTRVRAGGEIDPNPALVAETRLEGRHSQSPCLRRYRVRMSAFVIWTAQSVKMCGVLCPR